MSRTSCRAPVLALAELAERAELAELVGQHLTLAGDGGANAAVKVTSLVAGMLAGADCIDLCRHRDYADTDESPSRNALVR